MSLVHNVPIILYTFTWPELTGQILVISPWEKVCQQSIRHKELARTVNIEG